MSFAPGGIASISLAVFGSNESPRSSRESRVRRVLEHTIDIHATPEQVWEALTGFEAYDGWNPFMRRVAGAPEVGSRLRIELSPPDGRRIVVSPSVVVADPARELRWRGALPLGLFTGEHAFLITPGRLGRTRRSPRLVPRTAGADLRLRDRPYRPRVRAHAPRAQGAGRGAVAAGDRRAAHAERHRARDPRLRGARLDASDRGRARRGVGARRRARRRAGPGSRRGDARPSRRRRLAAGRRRAGAGDGGGRDTRRVRAPPRRAPGHARRCDGPAPAHAGRRRDRGDHRRHGRPDPGRRPAPRRARCLDAHAARLRLRGGRVRGGGGERPRPGARGRRQRGTGVGGGRSASRGGGGGARPGRHGAPRRHPPDPHGNAAHDRPACGGLAAGGRGSRQTGRRGRPPDGERRDRQDAPAGLRDRAPASGRRRRRAAPSARSPRRWG